MKNKLVIELADTKSVPTVYVDGKKLDHIMHLDIRWDTDTDVKKPTYWSVAYSNKGDEIIMTTGEYY